MSFIKLLNLSLLCGVGYFLVRFVHDRIEGGGGDPRDWAMEADLVITGAILLLGAYVLIGKKRPAAGRIRRTQAAACAVLVLLTIGFNATLLLERKESDTRKIFVIGLDAADWYLLTPLMLAGDLPNITRLVENGTSAPLRTILPTSSPIIWNSIATGKVKEKHGIIGFAEKIDDDYHPYTSNQVKAWPVWDLLNQGGIKTNVVGWWNTWPARELNGQMISSYMSMNQRLWKGSITKGVPNQTYPAGLIDEISPFMEEAESVMPGRIERVFGSIEESEANEATRSNYLDTRWCLLSDEVFHQGSLYLQQKYPAPFFTVYLGGVDVIGHRFWKYMEPWAYQEYSVTEEEEKRYGRSIMNYYQVMDEFIGDYLELADENTTVIIVSDHGMRAYPPSSNPEIAERTGAHDNAEEGIIILWGKNIKKSQQLRQAPTIFDIAPTILYLMGQPVDSDMDGRVVLAAVEEEYKRAHPVQKKRYPQRRQAEEGFIASEYDSELIERLKALGYLK